MILAGIHLLFKIAINLKILEILRYTFIGKLFVHKNVRWEVINVAFLRIYLAPKNSAKMVK